MCQHVKCIATKMEKLAGKGQRDYVKQRPSTAIHFLHNDLSCLYEVKS